MVCNQIDLILDYGYFVGESTIIPETGTGSSGTDHLGKEYPSVKH